MFALGAVRTNNILGQASKSIASRQRKLVISLYSELARPHQECCAHFGAPPVQERHGHTRASSVRGHQDIDGAEAQDI